MSRSAPDVYLAGPISGQSYGGATDWRIHARERLAKVGITAFSPMRAKEYLSAEQKLSGSPTAYEGLGLSNPKGIVTRDRFDCTTVDLVFINLLPAEENGMVSIGTMIEIGWADAVGTPIILVMTEDNPHYHAMVTEIAGYIIADLDDALALTEAILLPSPNVDLMGLHRVTPAGHKDTNLTATSLTEEQVFEGAKAMGRPVHKEPGAWPATSGGVPMLKKPTPCQEPY